MSRIIKYSDYELNEGVRDKMTPKPTEDIKNTFDKIYKEIEGKDILDKLEILNNKKVLRYLDEKQSIALFREMLKNNDKDNFKVTGQNDEFYLFDNKAGNGMFIFNKDKFKIYHVGLFALKEVVGALNYLI